VTSESRKIEPLTVSGSSSQSWRRTGMVRMIATQTATPMNGKCIGQIRELEVDDMLVATAKTSIRRR
jgi:hypothetical protein